MTTKANVEIGAMSMDELETVSGGVAPLLVAIAVGVGIVGAEKGAKVVGGALGWLSGGGSVSTIPWKDIAA
jgi:hypothetical protein